MDSYLIPILRPSQGLGWDGVEGGGGGGGGVSAPLLTEFSSSLEIFPRAL